LKQPTTVTHKQLVFKAACWLRTAGYKLVLTEPVTYCPEQPDAIGWKNGKTSALIECKTTMADFKRDQDKPSRKDQKLRIGQRRYYLAPKGLLKIEDLPDGWGLLELSGNSVQVTAQPKREAYSDRAAANELLILTHLLRRAEIRGVKLTSTWQEVRRKPIVARRIKLGDN
jgi:hypothetical protein